MYSENNAIPKVKETSPLVIIVVCVMLFVACTWAFVQAADHSAAGTCASMEKELQDVSTYSGINKDVSKVQAMYKKLCT